MMGRRPACAIFVERVEVWGPHSTRPQYEEERVEWHPAGATQPFTLDLRALFAPLVAPAPPGTPETPHAR